MTRRRSVKPAAGWPDALNGRDDSRMTRCRECGLTGQHKLQCETGGYLAMRLPAYKAGSGDDCPAECPYAHAERCSVHRRAGSGDGDETSEPFAIALSSWPASGTAHTAMQSPGPVRVEPADSHEEPALLPPLLAACRGAMAALYGGKPPEAA